MHNGVQQLVGDEKKKYDELKKELSLETEKLLTRCFPFAPGKKCQLQEGNSSASEDSGDEGCDEGDEVTDAPKTKRFRTFDWQGP